MNTFGLKRKVYTFGLGNIFGFAITIWNEIVQFSVNITKFVKNNIEF